MNKNPKITVIMPVYNSEKYLREAIESILDQTFKDFEFIIIDDGSKDDSVVVVKSFNDPRIKFIINEGNRGQSATYNSAFQMANGEYIAIMHSDDISLPNRFEEQVAFLDSHKDIGLCGAWVEVIGDTHRYVWCYEANSEILKTSTLFFCGFAHPTVMLRRSMFEKFNLVYDTKIVGSEDCDLWVKAVRCFACSNLNKVLLKYRLHPDQVSVLHGDRLTAHVRDLRRSQLINIGINPTEEELNIHLLAPSYYAPRTKEFITQVENWFFKLNQAIFRQNFYSYSSFKTLEGDLWYSLLVRNYTLGWWQVKRFLFSSVSKNLTFKQRVKFICKLLLYIIGIIK